MTPTPEQDKLASTLKRMIDEEGLLATHATWGPGAEELTKEERTRIINEAMAAPSVPAPDFI